MIDLKAGLYSFLQSKSIGVELFPDQAPQGTAYPYCTYYLQDSELPLHLGGASELRKDTISIMVYAATSESRTSVCEAFRNNLHGRKNVDFPQVVGSLDVRSISLIGVTESLEAPTDGSQQGSFVAQLDYLISWVEPLPTLP